MNHLDLVRMSIKNITVEMTESRKIRTLLGGNNKTVSVSELETMIIEAASLAPIKGNGYDKVFMILHFVNGESHKLRMDLNTSHNNLVSYIHECMAA